MGEKNMMDRYIYFNTRDTFFRVQLKQIVYFAADKNYTILQLNCGRKLIFTFSLQKMEEYLRSNLKDDAAMFARIGKSHIINLHCVFQIDIVRQKLKLVDREHQKEFIIELSKESLKNLRNLFINTTMTTVIN